MEKQNQSYETRADLFRQALSANAQTFMERERRTKETGKSRNILVNEIMR